MRTPAGARQATATPLPGARLAPCLASRPRQNLSSRWPRKRCRRASRLPAATARRSACGAGGPVRELRPCRQEAGVERIAGTRRVGRSEGTGRHVQADRLACRPRPRAGSGERGGARGAPFDDRHGGEPQQAQQILPAEERRRLVQVREQDVRRDVGDQGVCRGAPARQQRGRRGKVDADRTAGGTGDPDRRPGRVAERRPQQGVRGDVEDDRPDEPAGIEVAGL